eukprot:m.127361 g.127361  ORF g.127361 m.127361 type:complete len:124 (-) comp9721_c0_seq2:59-430(-)
MMVVLVPRRPSRVLVPQTHLLDGDQYDGKQMPEEGDAIIGLEVGREYWVTVEEDAEAEASVEKKAYKAPTTSSAIKTTDTTSLGGEDSSNCSCIEGNPCAVPYNCRDWENRFEIAKKNGWKGF